MCIVPKQHYMEGRIKRDNCVKSKKLQYKTEENTRMIVFCDIFVSKNEKKNHKLIREQKEN